jgi:hypothetical protein
VTSELSGKRLYRFLAVHVVLAAAPLLSLALPLSLAFIPVTWALFGLPIGSLMTLSVWVGMGSARITWRLFGALVATAYVTLALAMVSVAQMIYYTGSISVLECVTTYATVAAAYSVVVLLFGGMFGLVGRRFELLRVESEEVLPDREYFQFSLLHVLVIMSVVAVVLTLFRASRHDMESATSGTFQWSATDSLAFTVFLLNTLCAACAALWPIGVKRNVGLVMVVAGLLGLVLAFAMHNDQVTWWLFVGGTFMAIVPTATEVASLLYIRSCGYRLVRRIRRGEVTE